LTRRPPPLTLRESAPQAKHLYSRLIEENQQRSRNDPECELTDTGVFDGNRYFDV
jgi:hypothetical protein